VGVVGVLGDEGVQYLQRVLTAVLLAEVAAEPFAVLAVDLPAGLVEHAGNRGGVHRLDQVVLAG